jgi:DNA processing protein
VPLPQHDSEYEAWLALDLIEGIGEQTLRALLTAFGSPRGVLRQSRADLERFVPEQTAEALLTGPSQERLQASLKWLEGPTNHLITLADTDYPKLLLEAGDPPSVLYAKGKRELLGADAVAIVGSRNATPQGLKNAEAFAEALAHAGLCIVSGMALGIDTAAHRGGLQGAGSTIAVVGTGLDLVYPARNKALAQELAERGLMLSEFPLGTPALPAHFPRRNRIISGLSRGCLVVEAALASGSLITARLAGEQGRDVFAIPGSIHSPFSKGCHRLIKQGAKLVESAEDILDELGLSAAPVSASGNRTGKLARKKDALLDALGFDPVSFDALIERTGTSADILSGKLVEWEIEGRVAALPGNKYQRLQ